MAEDELRRLYRVDIQAANLWFFAKRLVEWDCGNGPSAAELTPGQVQRQEQAVEAYSNRVRKLIDPQAPDRYFWAPDAEKCLAQPELADCIFQCRFEPGAEWCDE